jgi:hypothetical protein
MYILKKPETIWKTWFFVKVSGYRWLKMRILEPMPVKAKTMTIAPIIIKTGNLPRRKRHGKVWGMVSYIKPQGSRLKSYKPLPLALEGGYYAKTYE